MLVVSKQYFTNEILTVLLDSSLKLEFFDLRLYE